VPTVINVPTCHTAGGKKKNLDMEIAVGEVYGTMELSENDDFPIKIEDFHRSPQSFWVFSSDFPTSHGTMARTKQKRGNRLAGHQRRLKTHGLGVCPLTMGDPSKSPKE